MPSARLNPKFNLRLVFDDFPPVKQRSYDYAGRHHSKIALIPDAESAGQPWHTPRGWTTKPTVLSDDAEHTLVPTMSGSWGPDLLLTATGRKSMKPDAFSGSPESTLFACYKNAYKADGSSDFTTSGGETGPTWLQPAPIERWFVSTANHTPDTPLFMKFELPPNTRQGPFMRVIFTGPWGCVNGTKGNGRYLLTLFFDGSATLQEYTGSEWFDHAKFRLFPHVLGDGTHELVICPHAWYDGTAEAWVGSTISFCVGPSAGHEGLIDLAINAIEATNPRAHRTGGIEAGKVINVNDGSATGGSVAPGKAIIDVRRDVAMQVHISELVQPNGQFYDAPFYLLNGDIDATTDDPVWLSWFGYTPPGADLDLTLYAWNGASWEACTPTAVKTTTTNGYMRPFQLLAGANVYYPDFTYTSNSSGRAPSLSSWKAYRAGLWTTPGGVTPITVSRYIDEIFVDDGGPDPTQQMAHVVFYDNGALRAPLELRSEVPIRIEADILDPRDVATVCTAYLFVGRVLEAQCLPCAAKVDGAPPGVSRKYILSCIGEGIRLTEMVANTLIKLTDPGNSTDSGDAKPMKVTEAIKMVFGNAGTPSDGLSSMIDCPDWGMRLSVAGNTEELYLEAYSDLWSRIKEWTEDYLGCYMNADFSAIPAGAAAADHRWGMFRVKTYPQGTENAVAQFVEKMPVFAGEQPRRKLFAVWGSYVDPNVDAGSKIAIGQVEVHTAPEPLRTIPVAPEINEIIVTGVGVPKSTEGSTLAKALVQLPAIIRNYKSAQFFADQPIAPDPTSVDFVGHVKTGYECDSGWPTQQVVDNIAKRTMRMAGQGYFVKTFQSAALFMWDSADALQARPRLVKFGDVVEYVDMDLNVSKWIVARARLWIHQHHGGSAFARCIYQLHSPLPEGDWVIDRSDQS